MSNESDALARQEATILATVPTPATAVDNRGVERIIEPYTDGWKPAPVGPDPDEVARLKRIGGSLEDQKKTRQELFKTGIGSKGASTGAEDAKKALEKSTFGGGKESKGQIDGPAEDVAAGPGQIRDEKGRSQREQLEAETKKAESEGKKAEKSKDGDDAKKAEAKAAADKAEAEKAAAAKAAAEKQQGTTA